MDCNHSREMMSAYLDDELDAGDRQRIEAQLSDCASCRDALEELEALRGSIATQASRYAAPEYLQHRIRAALQAERPRVATTSPAPARRAGGPRSWSWAWINLGLAGAAAAAFAVTLTLYLGQPSSAEMMEQELVASHFRALMPDHLADVVSTDQHTVKPWFAGKLDFSPPVIDLAAQGYVLVGGRLDYLQQRSVAALAYRHRKHIMNLFIWPDVPGHNMAPQASSRQGFQLLRWTQDGMHYSAISDMNPQDLAEFSHQLRAQVSAQSNAPLDDQAAPPLPR